MDAAARCDRPITAGEAAFVGVRRGRSRVDSAALVAPNPSQPEPVATAAMTRAERHALGRRLLAEGGVLWSALPLE